MPALRANSGLVPEDHHDEIRIHHFAFGARPPDPGAGDERGGSAFVTIIRKRPHHPPLSAGDVASAVRDAEFETTSLDGWGIGSCEVGECTDPRCVQVFYALSPPANTDGASYAAIAPRVAAVLPRSWPWFLTRLVALGRTDLRPRRPAAPRPDISPEIIAEHPIHIELVRIITEKANREGAFRGSRERYSVSTLALDMGLSRRTLERHAFKFSGKGVLDLAQDIRLAVARGLLPKCRTVREVAHRVGYSPQHFSKLFRDRYGQHPSGLLME